MKIMNIKEFAATVPPKEIPEGHIRCPECRGYGVLVQKGDEKTATYLMVCRKCAGHGHYEPCPYCGGACKTDVFGNQCEGYRRAEANKRDEHSMQRERELWRRHAEKHDPVPFSATEECPVWFSSQDKFITDDEPVIEAWLEANDLTWDQIDQAPPIDPEWARLYDTASFSLTLPDAEELVGQILGDFCSDPQGNLTPSQEAINELDAFLKEWSEKYLTDIGYETDFDRPMLPPDITHVDTGYTKGEDK